MPFITQGKANWKFLLIVIILAAVVGGGAFWYAKRPEKPYQQVQIKKTETIEILVDGESKKITSINLPIDKEEAQRIIKNFCESSDNPSYFRYDYGSIVKVNHEWQIKATEINSVGGATIDEQNGTARCYIEPFLTDETAEKKIITETINEFIPKDYQAYKERIKYILDDLDNNGKKEILLVTDDNLFFDISRATYVVLISIDSGKENYKKIVDLTIADYVENEYFGIYMIDKLEAIDMDNDNQKEVILSWSGGGSRYRSGAILDINFSDNKIIFLKLKKKDNYTSNIFSLYSRGAYGYMSAVIEDIDKDGNKEIINQIYSFSSEKPQVQKLTRIKQLESGDWESCGVEAYEWDDSFFSFNEDISEKALESKCQELN